MIMGLPISIHRRGTPVVDDAFAAKVFQDLRAADTMFSPYRADSLLTQLTAGDVTESELPQPFAAVLRLAADFQELTDGAFDVRFSGELDPSGLVKGWATERASRWMPPDAYLNAGGDMVIKSPNLPWRIGIEHPSNPSGLLAVLSVQNAAVATAGPAHRGQHILVPRTRRPAAGLRQTSVVGPSLTEADVWATALIARGTAIFNGRDPLLARLVARGFQALLVTEGGEIRSTEGFAPYCAPDLPLRVASV